LWAAWEIDNNLDYFTPERLEKLPPLVFISAPRPSLSTVSVGNYEGARLATCHLLSSGCRKVGIITGPNRFRGSQDRLLGWKDCLHQANIEVETSLVAEGDWSSASGEAGARQLLATHPDLDGIFATNDRMALGALGCLHQMGRRVPEDVAVVGFDNSPESAHFWPPLTTIYQHLTEIGTTAVQLLCERIETRRKLGCESPPEQRYMTPHLVIRRSSQRTS
jgi:LacI family transcriptional regulator